MLGYPSSIHNGENPVMFRTKINTAVWYCCIAVLTLATIHFLFFAEVTFASADMLCLTIVTMALLLVFKP